MYTTDVYYIYLPISHLLWLASLSLYNYIVKQKMRLSFGICNWRRKHTSHPKKSIIMMSTTFQNQTFLDEMCPNYTDNENKSIRFCDFWIDGVFKSCLAIWGILTNAMTCFILTRPMMKNSFNLSLTVLAIIDSTYLFFEVLKTFYLR